MQWNDEQKLESFRGPTESEKAQKRECVSVCSVHAVGGPVVEDHISGLHQLQGSEG